MSLHRRTGIFLFVLAWSCGAVAAQEKPVTGLAEPAKLLLQISNDLTLFSSSAPTKVLVDSLGYKNTYWIRMDLGCQLALAPTTRINSLLALRILNMDSGAQTDFSYTLLQCEIEQLIGSLYKIRLGRLAEKFSESRFFGRIDLGLGDVHVFGRTPFVNDALELAVNSDRSAFPLALSVGVKPRYAPADFAALYVVPNISLPLGGSAFKGYLTYTLHKQYPEDLNKLFSPSPGIKDSRFYHACEAEVSCAILHKVTAYVNAGGLADYIGRAPHYAGPRDILSRGNEPLITNANRSMAQTLTLAGGLKTRPGDFIHRLKSFSELMVEAEYVGMGNSIVHAYNFYGHLRYDYGKIALQYGLFINNPRFAATTVFKAGVQPVLAADELLLIQQYFRVLASL
jgi:hypothetical protein